jgi:hypothetical protein
MAAVPHPTQPGGPAATDVRSRGLKPSLGVVRVLKDARRPARFSARNRPSEPFRARLDKTARAWMAAVPHPTQPGGPAATDVRSRGLKPSLGVVRIPKDARRPARFSVRHQPSEPFRARLPNATAEREDPARAGSCAVEG